MKSSNGIPRVLSATKIRGAMLVWFRLESGLNRLTGPFPDDFEVTFKHGFRSWFRFHRKPMLTALFHSILAAFLGWVIATTWQWYQTKEWEPAVETNPYDCVLPLQESIKYRCVYSAIG